MIESMGRLKAVMRLPVVTHMSARHRTKIAGLSPSWPDRCLPPRAADNATQVERGRRIRFGLPQVEAERFVAEAFLLGLPGLHPKKPGQDEDKHDDAGESAVGRIEKLMSRRLAQFLRCLDQASPE